MRKWLLLIALSAMSITAKAQCAMCKAAAETDLEGGQGVADGLNEGILYLMAFPYLLIGGVAFMWYRHQKQKKQDVEA